MEVDYDAIIVGAGPSGIACARELKAAGISFCILDHSRPDSANFLPNLLPPKTLEQFGDVPTDIQVGSCERYVVGTRDRLAPVPAAVNNASDIGVFVNRNAYLKFLREPLHEEIAPVHALDFTVKPDGVEVRGVDVDSKETCTFTARVVVVATGGGGMQFGAPQIPVPKLIKTIWATYTPLDGTDRDDVGELALIWNEKVSKKGYINWYNVPGKAFFLAIMDHGDEDALSEMMRKVVERHPFVSELLGNSSVVQQNGKDFVFLDFPEEVLPKTYGDRFLVTGTRAGFVNTYVREGTWQALTSGRCAGEAVVEATRVGDYSASTLKVYEDKWKERVDRPNLKPGRASHSVFYDSGKLNLIADALARGLVKESKLPYHKRVLQSLFLQTMLSSEYSRKNDLTWAKAILKNVNFVHKVTIAPILLKAAFKG
ncbi:MAG: NAD(P)/FAD-dependent oxidoreductase [Promethearchaeota archaeon]